MHLPGYGPRSPEKGVGIPALRVVLALHAQRFIAGRHLLYAVVFNPIHATGPVHTGLESASDQGILGPWFGVIPN